MCVCVCVYIYIYIMYVYVCECICVCVIIIIIIIIMKTAEVTCLNFHAQDVLLKYVQYSVFIFIFHHTEIPKGLIIKQANLALL